MNKVPDDYLLASIDTRSTAMCELLVELCEINSHTYHVAGVERVLDRVERALTPLADCVERLKCGPATRRDARGVSIDVPLAGCLVARKRADAKTRVLLNIHADTVYPFDSAFQRVTQVDQNTLNGPGVVDAKGGLVVMLAALSAFEESPLSKHLGWEVIINPDEEIGSPGSASLLEDAARRNHYGLLFEPALPDGSLVSSRKGSGIYTITVHGRAAHAGRAIEQGRNAVVAASEIAIALHAANATLNGGTINIGQLNGGSAANVVPDFATIVLNARAIVADDVSRIEDIIFQSIKKLASREGYSAEVQGSFSSMPKPLDAKTNMLLDLIFDAGASIGLALDHGPSGGASDGNRLAAAGLPNIDSLGPRGGELHSPREFIRLDSLAERAKLTLAVLMRIAAKHAR